MTNKKRIQKLVFLFAGILLACNGADQTAPVGQLLPAETLDPDAERKRLQEMQYLIVKSADPNDPRQEIWDLNKDIPGGAMGLLENMIGRRTQEQCNDGNDGTPEKWCREYTCVIRNDLASAARVLRATEGASVVGSSLGEFGNGAARLPLVVGPVHFDNTESISLPPQNAATRVLLAQKAAAIYRLSLQEFILPLVDDPVDWLGDRNYTCNTAGYEDLRAAAAAALREALNGLEKANFEAARLMLATADKQLGSSTHAAISTARAFAGEELSRAAGAHLLVGGLPGVEGKTTKALCSSSELTGETQQAINVIRQLAPDPVDILAIADAQQAGSDGGLDAFLNGASGEGSLRERFEQFYGGITPIDSIEEHTQLRANDFGLAIAALAQEIRAFGRSLEVVVSGDKPSWTYERYAAVFTPPSEPPDAYWAALARTSAHLDGSAAISFLEVPGEWTSNIDGLEPDVPLPFANAAAMLVRWASKRMATAPPAAQQILNLLVSSSETLGVFEQRQPPSPSTGQMYGVQLFRDEGKSYYLAIGDNAMRCAVDGLLEAEPCNPWAGAKIVAMNTAVAPVSPGLTVSRFTPVIPAVGSNRVYLLTRRPGWVPTATETQPGAGDFEVIIGMAPHRMSVLGATSWRAKRIGITPSVEKRAAELMKLSREDCTRPQLTCAATAGVFSNLGRFDERLPLENELSDDGDGIESSWKYYLTQARNAAEESDLLAKEYMDTSLTFSLRQESEGRRAADMRRAQEEKAAASLDRLQAICGTTVDPRTLLDKIDWLGGMGPCTVTEPAPANWTCVNGLWTASLGALLTADPEPELAKLGRCLVKAGETTDLQLSKQDLCYWTDVEGNACQGTPPAGAAECPTLPESPGVCNAGYTEYITKEESLQLFDFVESSATSLEDNFCGHVRAMRQFAEDGTGSYADEALAESTLAAVVASGIYNEPKLQELRAALSVEATYGGFVNVDLGGRSWFSTGSALTGASGTWPCASDPPPGCSTHGGFRCDAVDCADPVSRAALNDRILDAFIALESTSLGEVYLNNPELESHIEFWLPTRLAQGLYPEDYHRRSRSFHSSMGLGDNEVYEWSSNDWRVYSPNGPLDLAASLAMYTRRGDVPGILGTVDDPSPDLFRYSLAFARTNTGPVFQLPTVNEFYGGLGNVGTVQNGYFMARLMGKSHQQAMMAPANLVGEHLERLTTLLRLINYREELRGNQIDAMSYCLNGPDVMFFGIPIGAGDELDADEIQLLQERILEDKLVYDTNDEVPPTVGAGYACHSGGAIRPIGASIDLSKVENERALWDALELACEANTTPTNSLGSQCTPPDTIEGTGDLFEAATYLDCAADTVARRATSTIFQAVPARVVDSLQSAGVDSVTAELGQIHSHMREAITDLAASGEEFGRIFRGFGVELRQIDSRIRELELMDELADLQFSSTAADRITSCVVAVSEGAGWFKNLASFGVHWAGVAATCVNAGAQTGFAARIRDVSKEINEEQRKYVFGDAETEMLRLEDAVANEAQHVNSLLESLQRYLAQIESLRDEATRSVNDAVWYLSQEDIRMEVIDNAMEAEEVTAQHRYQQAHENAQRWSFLARRAIEQRLGVDLAAVHEDLPLVSAPRKWVDSVCATKPVNFDDVDKNNGYADVFIGDYVTKLENVVESYRLQFGFQEGADVAVVSLRDDVMNARAECEVPSTNLLFHSDDLGGAEYIAESVVDQWQVLGCPDPAAGNGLGFDSSCLSVGRVESPFQVPSLEDSGIYGYELEFSDGTSDCSENPEQEVEGVVTGGCSWTPETRLTQSRSLLPGLYRFSWYSPPNGAQYGLGQYAGAVWGEDGEEIVAAVQSVPGIPGRVWDRHFVEFELEDSTVVEVGFRRGDEAEVAAWEDEWRVTVGAPALDIVETQVPEEFRGPKPFQKTGDTLTVLSPQCEDSDGEVFRTRWKRACETVCPEGFGGICPEDAVEQCYRETSFFISQRSIQSGKTFVKSGFALGNFNYRLSSVALNLVGTGLRDCEGSDAPSTCFGSGNVSYSLYHKGPYYVHNHYGEDYRAYLFDGTIEHARALAAERYLSNPVSATDRELLTDFVRLEYQGRPMDGHFVLRVWEEDGFDFEALEDVQLVLDYQYWSR